MDGYTLDDLIFRRDCSLTEDEVVAYVRRLDPTYQVWDDWPLRMTFRINSFLRANGANPEPDLDILNLFSHSLPFMSSHAMDPTLAHWTLSHQHSHANSALHFFLEFYLTLKQYGGWIKPIQCRLLLFLMSHVTPKTIPLLSFSRSDLLQAIWAICTTY